MKRLVLGLMEPDAAPDAVIAAGPWCFCGREKEFPNWEQNFLFCPEPLADRARLASACRAAQFLCIKLIPETARTVSPDFNKLPPVYWQILLFPWLIDLTSQLVERALRCEAMLQIFGDDELEVPLLPSDCVFNFADERDFTLRGSLGVVYNHWLFSRLLENAWPQNWRKIELPPATAQTEGKKGGFFAKIRDAGRDLGLRLAFPKIKGISAGDAIRLSDALNHKCQSPDRSLDPDRDFNFPEDLARIPLPKDLSPIIRASLPRSLLNLRHKACERDKSGPKLRIAAISSAEDAAYRQRLASWVASGNRLAHIQHGGNYGEVATPCAASLCEYSQQAFFTWGWQTQGTAKGNFIPMPSLLLASSGKWSPGEKLIFVGTEMSAYGRRLDSHPTPLQFTQYREEKAAFFANLGQDLQEKSLYRPYFPLPGCLEDENWLLPRFPALKICDGDLMSQALACRLLVIDHPGTTFLEALATGIPVVAYWNPDFWPFAPEAATLLTMLWEAGVWHETPQKAAQAVREIWTDPESWNNSPERRLARRVFCRFQALTAADALDQWRQKLKYL